MNFRVVLTVVIYFTYTFANPVEVHNIEIDEDVVVVTSSFSLDNLSSEENEMNPIPEKDNNYEEGEIDEKDDLMQADGFPQKRDDITTDSNNFAFTERTTVETFYPSVVSLGSTIKNTGEVFTTETITSKIGDSYTTTISTPEAKIFEESTTDLSTTETSRLDESDNFVDDNVASTTEVSTVSEGPEISTQEINNNTNEQKKSVYVDKLSDQIRRVLEKYKESGNVVIPNVPIPDPLRIPDMDKRFSMINMNFKNQTVYGLSNFTVQHINTDLEKMQVYVMLHMKRLVILGNYTMRSLFSRAAGPFNVTLLNVTTEGAAALHYTPEGNLETSETDMDMFFNDIKLDFKNLGFMGSFFQGVVGAVGSFIFEGIKPPILTEINTNVRSDINAKIRTLSSGVKTNSSISPVDQAVIEGRRYIRTQGYDPYRLFNYTKSLGIFNLNIIEFNLKGLSRFYKVGGVSLSMDNGTIEFGIHLATDKLIGNCKWSAGVSKTPVRQGINAFSVDHLQIRAIVQQSLDLTQHPVLYDLDFLLGNITLKTQREDTIDFVTELVVNNLPSLLRHLIVDALEEPVKIQAQKILDEVDVESVVDEQLPNLDKLGV